MNLYRIAARDRLTQTKDVSDIPDLNLDTAPPDLGLQDLWEDISANERPDSIDMTCENILVVESFLRNCASKCVDKGSQQAGSCLLAWVTANTLPSEKFADSWEDAQFADDSMRKSIRSKHQKDCLKSTAGITALKHLDFIISLDAGENFVDTISALAAFTCQNDPWATEESFHTANLLLRKYESILRSKGRAFENVLREILQNKVKPSFSKTKTPAITPAGRKNVHPTPQPNFDPALFDPASKPWKYKNPYIVTILTWIIHQYNQHDKSMIEAQFPLLVPAILSLIDDDSHAYKKRGCDLLHRLLDPLAQGKSDILHRTNLDSVFKDALTPCLLSIPTITPEDESIQLLSSAYPALLSVILTRFPNSLAATPKQLSTLPPSQRKKAEQESQARLSYLTHIMRHNIISSYLHTSSPRPTEDTSISSYPHPRLSTLLLAQLTRASDEIGIHTIKYLQDIIPLLTSTLTNPFGTAYLPLLKAAVECTRSVIINSKPRIWRWRGEILAGLCGCWLYICDDDEDIKSGNRDTDEDNERSFEEIRAILKEVVVLLKAVVSNKTEGDGIGKKIDIDAEFRELVDGDDRLRGLLF